MWFWLFIVSVCLNIFMLLYVRWLLSSLAVINTDVANVSDLIADFSAHLSSVHELEMFYGDENLKSLIDHSNILIETLNDIDLMLDEKEEDEASPTP
ncbi:hypothetical protein CL634_00595 [bacterium]|nr:hypothetical protein [bacterium]